MKIAVLLPDLRGGGAERVAVNLANGFAQRGYAVDMVLLSGVGEFMDRIEPRYSGVVDLNAPRVRWSIIPLVRYLRNSQDRTQCWQACGH